MALPTGITYGTSSGFGLNLEHNEHLFDGVLYQLDTGDGTSPVQTSGISGGSYSTLPLQVPRQAADGTNGNTVVAPSSISNTGGGTNPTTERTAVPSLLNTVEGIVAHPGQHVVGAVILAILAWWFYKHILKKV